MFDFLRFPPMRLNIFSMKSFALIILVVFFFADSIISNFSLNSGPFENRNSTSSHRNHLLTVRKASQKLKINSADDDHVIHLVPRLDVPTIRETVIQPENKLKPEDLQLLFDSSDSARRFDSKVRDFFIRNQCKVQIFMTWIAPLDSFGDRELSGLESLFQTNPTSCLIILSRALDSEAGRKILKPLIDRGFRAQTMSPDLWGIFKKTPGEVWLNDIKNGNRDPGDIPLAQNLSNLLRLAVLYKYGGVYLDTDFIILKDFSGLRNSIGAQSVDINGNWTRLNNAVLVFDKKHPLVYKFMEEFALNYDGNRWGHNGPYLVSRVVNSLDKPGELNFTILPPMAFYPVDWTRVASFFARPHDRVWARWVKAKIQQLRWSSYGVHLWNKQSSRLKIEEGSIVGRLISDHCVICSSRHIASGL